MSTPIPMLLWCPMCGARHVDKGEFAIKVHTSHACQECGMTWRPALVATVGVQFLPGFKDGEKCECGDHSIFLVKDGVCTHCHRVV